MEALYMTEKRIYISMFAISVCFVVSKSHKINFPNPPNQASSKSNYCRLQRMSYLLTRYVQPYWASYYKFLLLIPRITLLYSVYRSSIHYCVSVRYHEEKCGEYITASNDHYNSFCYLTVKTINTQIKVQ